MLKNTILFNVTNTCVWEAWEEDISLRGYVEMILREAEHIFQHPLNQILEGTKEDRWFPFTPHKYGLVISKNLMQVGGKDIRIWYILDKQWRYIIEALSKSVRIRLYNAMGELLRTETLSRYLILNSSSQFGMFMSELIYIKRSFAL